MKRRRHLTALTVLLTVLLAVAHSPLRAQPVPAPDARTTGLQLHVYDVGQLRRLHDLVPGQTPNVAMVVPGPNLHGVEAFGVKGFLENGFLAELTGFLIVPDTGEYTFELRSDDGSELLLAGRPVLNHDGLHSFDQIKTATVRLDSGIIPIRLRMFEAGGYEQLSLRWKRPNIDDFEHIPDSALFTQANVVQVTSPGRKRVVPLLSNLRPGDGTPLTDLHPSFTLTPLHNDTFQPKVGGMDFLPDGRLALCTWDPEGAVYLITNPHGDPADMTISKYATGLAEPLGLTVVDNDIYVLQFHELTRLVDQDADGFAETHLAVCNSWAATSNFHEFAFGLIHLDGHFYANLAVAINPGGRNTTPAAPERGSVIRINPRTGTHEIIAQGLRTPNGIGLTLSGDIYLTDNQGDYLPSSTLMRLEHGAFYGAHKTPDHAWADRPVTPPVAWLPQGEIGNSPSQPTDLRVGPWKGQILHGDVTHGGLKRTFIDPVTRDGKTVLNGAVFRFSQGFTGGTNRIVWGPDGSLYVGQIGSTGDWAQDGKKWFGLERISYTGEPTFEPLAVRMRSNGLEVEFTQPLNPATAREPSQYTLRQWRYQRTSAYGGGKLDETPLPVRSATLSPDHTRIFLETDGLKDNHVVYLRLPHSLRDTAGRSLWTTEAWYTLNALPDTPAQPGPPAVHNTLTPEQSAAGWKLLFDGQTTAGWRGFRRPGMPAGWQVIDGALTRVAGAGDIITTEQFDHFELELEWKVEEGGNSGIFFRVAEDAGSVWETGPEMQVLDNQRHPDGRSALTSAGACYALYPPARDTSFPAGTWNTVRLIVHGSKVEHHLNGEKIVEYDLASPDWAEKVANSKFRDLPRFGKVPRGHIALQDHGDRVAYRNLRIRPLPAP